MKRRVRIISILFIITLFFNSVFALDSYETFESELQNIKKRLEDSNKNIDGIEREINFILIEICDIDKEISKVESEKVSAEKKIETAKVEVKEKEVVIEELNQIVETDTLYYEKRLRDIYENGTLDFWEIVITSKNFTDFLKRYNILTSIIESDKKMYITLSTKQEKLETTKETISIRTREIENYQKERENKLTELLAEKEKRQVLITKLQSDKELAFKQTEMLQKQENELNQQLEQEIMRLIEQYRSKTGTISGTPNAAGFVWPLGGTFGIVTATFPVYPPEFGGGKHDGIDIASKSPDPVRACKKGTVIKAVTDRPQNTYPYSMQYGNHIIILHEDGVTTSLYGHLSSGNVAVGDVVETGQQIGVIGNSGYSTGQHLHFEIRVNAVPQNPLSYVK